MVKKQILRALWPAFESEIVRILDKFHLIWTKFHWPTPPRRKIVLGLGAALIAVWVLWSWLSPDDAPIYRTAEVQRGDISVTVLAAGAIEAKQLVSVGARVSGQIDRLAVRLGQDVKAGDVIAQIDAKEQENDLLKAKSALAQIEAQITAKSSGLRKAQTVLTRQTQLRASQFVSKEALDNAAADVEMLQAEIASLAAQKSSAEVTVAQSELALSRATVTAPISGTVVAVVVKEGQTVSAAQNAPTIVKIANLNSMIVKAEISEADIVRVKAGQTASFTILGAPEMRFDAVVRDVEPAPSALAESDTIPADKAIYYNGLLEVDNPERQLRIGMTAQVSIVLDQAKDVLLVPAAALTQGPQGASVQVLMDDQPQMRAVKTGLNDKVRVQILEGLSEGEIVVIGAGRDTNADMGAALDM